MTTFDLEERMLIFASDVRDFLLSLPQTAANRIYTDQLLRSSSSVGANYIEGNDAIGDKDFLVKIRTSRREAKESRYWLRLLQISNEENKNIQHRLADEAEQFVRILSAITSKVQKRSS
jgi:four helix bundle protein